MMRILGARLKEAKSSDEIFTKVDTYRKENEVFIQLLDTKKVIGEEHLIWAYEKAEEVFKKGTNRANSPEMETLLWASAQWQIKDAIEKMGIDDDVEEVALIIEKDEDDFLEYMGWVKDDDILEPDIEKLKNFGLKDEEINSVSDPFDLVFEKMATSIL